MTLKVLTYFMFTVTMVEYGYERVNRYDENKR